MNSEQVALTEKCNINIAVPPTPHTFYQYANLVVYLLSSLPFFSRLRLAMPEAPPQRHVPTCPSPACSRVLLQKRVPAHTDDRRTNWERTSYFCRTKGDQVFSFFLFPLLVELGECLEQRTAQEVRTPHWHHSESLRCPCHHQE